MTALGTTPSGIDLEDSGVIFGGGAFTKVGNGKLLLSTSTNTYGGATTISAGTLVAANGGSLGTTAAGTTVASGATLDVQALLDPEAISILGTGAGGNGALVTGTGSGTVTGAVTLTGDTSMGGAGALNLAGTQTYASLTTNGGITNVNSAIGTGSSTVTANATTHFNVSQTLTSLTIGDGAEVTFGDGLPFAGGPQKFGAPALVPEPGSIGLLLTGTLGLLGRRRRRA